MHLLMPHMKKVKANHFPREACMEYEGVLYNEHKPLIQGDVDAVTARKICRQKEVGRVSYEVAMES